MPDKISSSDHACNLRQKAEEAPTRKAASFTETRDSLSIQGG